MMESAIQNRDEFLNQIAYRLGRERIIAPIERPKWKYRPQEEVLKNATQDELLDVLKEQCKKIHTSICITELENLPAALNDIVSAYGGGPIVTWKDERFSQWGIRYSSKRGMGKL